MYIRIPDENEPNNPSIIKALGLLSSYPVAENKIIPSTIPIGVVTANMKHMYAVVVKLNAAWKNKRD